MGSEAGSPPDPRGLATVLQRILGIEGAIYGAFFTMLALVYAPIYFTLLQVGRANVDAACKMAEPASTTWLATYEKRRKLEEHVQLEIATSASFRTGVAILAPLTSALVALLLDAA